MHPNARLAVAAFLLTQSSLTLAETLPEVRVTAKEDRRKGPYNSDGAGGPKLGPALVDTPQTVTAVPERVREDQAATTLRDSLRNVTGLSLAAGEGGSQGDSFTLRGFSSRSDIYLDGMRDFGNYYRDGFNVETLDVAKGPSSTLFGRGSTGGAVLQGTRQPRLETLASGSVLLGTDHTRRATADVNRRLGESSALRVGVMAHQNQVAGRDAAENRRNGLAPALAFGIGTRSRATLTYLHQTENNVPDYGVPILWGAPAAVRRENYYGFENENRFRSEADVLTLKLERDANETTTIRNQFRYGRYARDVFTTAPRVAGSPAVGTPLESITVNRSQVAVESVETTLDNDLSVAKRFATGGVRHEALVGVEAIHETSRPTRYSYTGVPTTNLANPRPADPFSGTGAVSSATKARATTLAGYALDQAWFDERFGLSAGARFDRLVGRYEQIQGTAPGTLTNRSDALSWRGSAIYKPSPASSIYAAYGTSFNPSIEQISLSSTTSSLDPERNRSYELGAKWDASDGRLSVQTALFRTEKTNARTPDPDAPALTILAGNQRVNGAELGVSGELVPRVRVFAGYTYMSGKVTKTGRAAELGNRLANVPRHTFTLWSAVDVAERWETGAGVYWISDRMTTTTPDANGIVGKVGAYATVAAMVRYAATADLDLQFNVQNLLDTEYSDSVYPGHVVPGAGRTFLLTAAFRM